MFRDTVPLKYIEYGIDVYNDNKIPIYPIFYVLKRDFKLDPLQSSATLKVQTACRAQALPTSLSRGSGGLSK